MIIKEEPGIKPPGEPKPSDGDRRVLKNGIQYLFYRKPMSSPFGILRRSAMCENTKVATAAAELKRRWKNSSQCIRKSKFEQITREYMEML